MMLFSLLQGIEHETKMGDIAIQNVTCDSRQVIQGSLFVAIVGEKFDGHQYVIQAIEKGAVAVVVQRDMGVECQIVVEDTRHSYALLCGAFYEHPAQKLKMIAITGTNGKTTCAFLTKQILEHMGKTVGLIGTVHNEIGAMVLATKHTTPDPLYLHSMLDKMVKNGCEYVVMEASSHALDQQRLAGISFQASAFTNLTVDHLDYHETMENYYQAKKNLFLQSKKAIVNQDDTYGVRLAKELEEEVVTFSVRSDAADYTAKNVTYLQTGTRFALVGEGTISRMETPMLGEYSLSNALTAVVLCMSLGFPMNDVAEGLKSIDGVSGRLETLASNDKFVILRDYAHTPDALQKVLVTLRQFARGRIVTLFGCAGERDRKKRAEMGRIVQAHSDYVILTSDNPRKEDPMQIINDALEGIADKKKVKIFVDRYEALQWAVGHLKEHDILILAGKGHEDYQVLDYGTICFDEKELVAEFLAKK